MSRHRHRRVTFASASAAPAAALALALTFPLVLAIVVLRGGAASATMTVPNARFEEGRTGWVAAGAATALSVPEAGRNATRALRVTSVSPRQAVVDSATRVTDGSAAGTPYVWTVWMRSDRTGLPGQLTVREYVDGRVVQTRRSTVGLVRGEWVQLTLEMVREQAGSRFGVRLGSLSQSPDDVLLIDDVGVLPLPELSLPTLLPSRLPTPRPSSPTPMPTPSATTPTPSTSATPTTPTTSATPTTSPSPTAPTTSPTPSPGDPAGPTLSNGCGTTRRGIPSCGAFLGATYGSNSDPTPMEDDMDRRLGVRRTYFTGSEVDSGVRTARGDLAAGRLPWISFKLPYSWADMASGRGDAWARDLASRLAALPGPVWLAFHHEPEGDGDIQTWRRMQERLAPIVRSSAPNVAYTVVLTGWHQLYGDAQYSLDAIWPRVAVDVAGFDVYNQYGVVKDGRTNTKGTNLRTAYFEPISRWAAARGVAWGISETGFTDRAALVDPGWVGETYRALRELDGVAFTYFNTTLNSVANWALTTAPKRKSYRDAAVGSPVLPRP